MNPLEERLPEQISTEIGVIANTSITVSLTRVEGLKILHGIMQSKETSEAAIYRQSDAARLLGKLGHPESAVHLLNAFNWHLKSVSAEPSTNAGKARVGFVLTALSALKKLGDKDRTSSAASALRLHENRELREAAERALKKPAKPKWKAAENPLFRLGTKR